MADSERRPKLVVLAGISGSGKSTVARGVADQTGTILIEADIAKLSDSQDFLPRVKPRSAGPSTREEMRAAYAAAQEQSRQLLELGQDVIMVAVNGSFIAQYNIREVAKLAKAEFHPYELRVSPEAAKQRVALRPGTHFSGITDPREIERMVRDFEEFPGAIVIDTSFSTPESVVRQIVTEVWGDEHYRPTNLRQALFSGFRRRRPQRLKTG